jgi:hypothetical protein
VTDRDAICASQQRFAIAPEQPEQEVEVVRRPIVPDVTDTPAKPDDPRSPGVTDRDISHRIFLLISLRKLRLLES